MEIPLKCLITVEMGKGTPVGRAVQAAELEMDAPKHVFLMLFVLTDRKKPDSFFKPYYDILPPTLSNMPIFWGVDELKWLEGSYLLQQVEDRKLAISHDYHSICEVYPQFRDIATLSDFMWARMCVCSRNFGLVVNGVRTSALVPYADMLNHFRPRETKWTFDNDRQAFTITTLQTIQSGAQVYDSYGQKCNHRFLLNYGFAIENNVEADGFCPNEVPIELRLNENDAVHHRKVSFWRVDGTPSLKRIRINVSDHDSTKNMLSLLRVIEADEAEFAIIEGGSRFIYRTPHDVRFPMSLRNEEAVMRRMMSIMQGYLNAYPTSLEENIEMLSGKDHVATVPHFSNRRHALVQVKGEKVVLRHYLDMAETALACMAAKTEIEMAVLCQDKHKLVQNYVMNVLAQIKRQEKAKVERLDSGFVMGPGPTIV
ncbi:unnamed protein product [Chrysoparadoxa australica]